MGWWGWRRGWKWYQQPYRSRSEGEETPPPPAQWPPYPPSPWYPPVIPPYPYYPPPPPTPEDELRMLEAYKRELEEELKSVEERIKELKKLLERQ